MQLDHTNGKTYSVSGDCSDSGKNAIDGAWSGYTYGTCSKSCGTGTQSMTRACDSPAPFNGGADCAGSTTSSQNCNTHACAVDGTWSGWTYGTCSTSCGAGTRSRTRTCDGRRNGGADCHGSTTSTAACDHGPCPVHCATSAFSGWSTCTKSCGTGSQSRSRSITASAASGGYVCPYLAETQNCNTATCAIDGTWSGYTAYNTCSQSCGTGTQSRTRTCDGQAFGGKACVGSTTDTRNCNTHACPVNGGWSGFSACNKACGGGTQARTCSDPTPVNGGAQCTGNASQSCNTAACPTPAPTPAPTPKATPACGASPAGGFPVLFNTHNHGPQSIGNYAHFDIAVVDALVGNTGWHSGNFKLKNVRTGVIGNAVLWRSHNRPNGGADEGHLR